MYFDAQINDGKKLLIVFRKNYIINLQELERKT